MVPVAQTLLDLKCYGCSTSRVPTLGVTRPKPPSRPTTRRPGLTHCSRGSVSGKRESLSSLILSPTFCEVEETKRVRTQDKLPGNTTTIAEIAPRMGAEKLWGKQTQPLCCQPLVLTFLPDIKLESVTERYKEMQRSKKAWGRNHNTSGIRKREGGGEGMSITAKLSATYVLKNASCLLCD